MQFPTTWAPGNPTKGYLDNPVRKSSDVDFEYFKALIARGFNTRQLACELWLTKGQLQGYANRHRYSTKGVKQPADPNAPAPLPTLRKPSQPRKPRAPKQAIMPDGQTIIATATMPKTRAKIATNATPPAAANKDVIFRPANEIPDRAFQIGERSPKLQRRLDQIHAEARAARATTVGIPRNGLKAPIVAKILRPVPGIPYKPELVRFWDSPTTNVCRRPIGDTSGLDLVVCGVSIDRSQSYCSHCSFVMTNPVGHTREALNEIRFEVSEATARALPAFEAALAQSRFIADDCDDAAFDDSLDPIEAVTVEPAPLRIEGILAESDMNDFPFGNLFDHAKAHVAA